MHLSPITYSILGDPPKWIQLGRVNHCTSSTLKQKIENNLCIPDLQSLTLNLGYTALRHVFLSSNVVL